MRSLLVASLSFLAASCSARMCLPDCVPGYEPVPNACTCRPVDDAGGGFDAVSDRTETGDADGGLASCDPDTLAAAIHMVVMHTGTPNTCAAPLPPTDASDADGARSATRAFLAATVA